MKKSLSLFTTKVRVCIAQDETNGGEEVTLARSIAADDDIVFRGERLDDGLILVAIIKNQLSTGWQNGTKTQFVALTS